MNEFHREQIRRQSGSTVDLIFGDEKLTFLDSDEILQKCSSLLYNFMRYSEISKSLIFRPKIELSFRINNVSFMFQKVFRIENWFKKHLVVLSETNLKRPESFNF